MAKSTLRVLGHIGAVGCVVLVVLAFFSGGTLIMLPDGLRWGVVGGGTALFVGTILAYRFSHIEEPPAAPPPRDNFGNGAHDE